jgi:hypothetical protein
MHAAPRDAREALGQLRQGRIRIVVHESLEHHEAPGG